MNEFSEIPAAPPPPPGKSIPWKIIIPVAIVIILCCLCLAVIGVLVYLGMQGSGPFTFLQDNRSNLVGDWDLYYSWDCELTYDGPATVTFYSDGTYYASEGTDGGYGTWTVTGSNVNFVFDDYPNANYLGTLDSTATYIEGTMSTADNSYGCFYANKR